MNIYCFYENIFDSDKNKRELELIEIWKESWVKFGWNPIVLTDNDLDITKEEHESLINLPTVNDMRYEMACYKRWKAMSKFGGWMSDYDVVNCGFTPDDTKEYIIDTKGTIYILQGHVPCLVYSDSYGYENMFNIFCGGTNYSIDIGDKKHTSDMIIISGLIKDNYKHIKSYHLVYDFPSESKLVHCSFACCSKNGVSKKEAMLKSIDKL